MLKTSQNNLVVGIYPKINKRGGSNNHVDGIFHQKMNKRGGSNKACSWEKRIRKTPYLLETSEYEV